MQIADKHGGAFLCDGVGPGKTFVGVMVIERLLHDRKKVVLLSPKAAKDPVWQATLKKYLPGAFGAWGGLRLFSHTDLGRIEWQTLVAQNPNLPAELDALPGRLFSGKAHPTPGARALFFCYVLPAKNENGNWTHDGGEVVWLLLDLASEKILDSPSRIAEFIRCAPETPRRVSGEDADLSKARVKVEKLLRAGQIKKLQIPMGQMDKPLLRCWMELL